MKILLLGANGQLGSELQQSLAACGALKSCARDEVDFCDSASIINVIDAYQPDYIVNSAAYTAVDKAESETELAFKINAEAVSIIAEQAKKHDAGLIHYSTDYVFDGSQQTPYLETDQTNPINVYGASKLAGEQAILASGCTHLIFRTTWVIGKNGNNFAKTILKLAQERDTLSIIDDQNGVPTTTDLIAKVTASALVANATTPWPSGIYNLAPHGKTTWYGIAKTLLQIARDNQIELILDDVALKPIPTSEYPAPASRPLNSLLDTTKLEQLLDFKIHNWQDDFYNVVNEIIGGSHRHEA